MQKAMDFNKSMFCFIDSLIKMTTDNKKHKKILEPVKKDLEVYKGMAELVISKSYNTPVKEFIKKVEPYIEKIKKKDETFFQTDKFTDSVVKDPVAGAEKEKDSLIKLLRFKEMWSYISESDKNYIYEMMNYLCILSGEYVVLTQKKMLMN